MTDEELAERCVLELDAFEAVLVRREVHALEAQSREWFGIVRRCPTLDDERFTFRQLF